MFVLFTLFKLTLDERKTLTKISMCKPLTTVPQTSARFRHEGTRKPAKSILQDADPQSNLPRSSELCNCFNDITPFSLDIFTRSNTLKLFPFLLLD